ncbi:Fe2+-enterobactin ABC transporter substrate-binding protein [Actinomycetaceae bacterium TAE3-ERU4]|nr:Fe2+-enterobactin ABC transporter substrate-binding protein [Actinomycetaceae bacterium TAE3-ERU4]
MISALKRSRVGLAIVLAGALALTGCSSTKTAEAPKEKGAMTKEAPATKEAGTFPLTFENADGSTTTIPAKPTRIVSTSVTLTGMAVPFKAPIVASATAANAKFFPAWAKAANEMKIQELWKAQSAANLEQVAAAKPDLILVSASGADSVKKQVKDLQKIAPTVVINYSKSSWQDVTLALGKLTGMEPEAQQVVDTFNKKVKDTAATIKLPDGQVNIISYNGAGKPNAVAKLEGPYGELFSALGFEVEGPNPNWKAGGEQGARVRKDFAFTSLENLTQLNAKTTFLIHGDEETAKAMMENPVLANVPSVKAKQVYPLGKQVFRLDYYTSQIVLEKINKLYGVK